VPGNQVTCFDKIKKGRQIDIDALLFLNIQLGLDLNTDSLID